MKNYFSIGEIFPTQEDLVKKNLKIEMEVLMYMCVSFKILVGRARYGAISLLFCVVSR